MRSCSLGLIICHTKATAAATAPTADKRTPRFHPASYSNFKRLSYWGGLTRNPRYPHFLHTWVEIASN